MRAGCSSLHSCHHRPFSIHQPFSPWSSKRTPHLPHTSYSSFICKFFLAMALTDKFTWSPLSFRLPAPWFGCMDSDSYLAGSNLRETPFMQYRRPVGAGPSSNTWPRCPLHRAQWTSTRTIPNLRSVVVSTAFSSGVKKLGQPVPLSNLESDLNSAFPHAAHKNTPGRYSLFSGLVPARS